ncbi:TetR/AcrR family transcriptional regulator [Streptomyces afghaniensis]|uniref:TetR/AcrR family transcriptional regulator n=1 Tax=Streptomyces afghaniensis TaxID=66865 RepID=UPI00042222F8|nr:TetR/AcrR family transcriptional regulator [Streptomyces afghaniensis]
MTSQRGNQSAVTARGRTAAGRAPGPRAVEIRNAALVLFAERGYAATTMADIGEAVVMRGPSLYKHVGSKQELLTQIMTGTMDDLLRNHRAAVAGCEDVVERLRRAAEAHVRYHARHRLEAFVGTREIRSPEEPHRAEVLQRRAAMPVRAVLAVAPLASALDGPRAHALLEVPLDEGAPHERRGPRRQRISRWSWSG